MRKTKVVYISEYDAKVNAMLKNELKFVIFSIAAIISVAALFIGASLISLLK